MSQLEVTRSVVVPAEPEEAWDALVEPARLEDWFADTVDGDELIPDAEVSFHWDDGERRDAVIEEVDAPNRLSFRWKDADGDESFVAFRLDEQEGGTRVTVIETGITRRAAARRAVARRSWGPALTAMAGALEMVAA